MDAMVNAAASSDLALLKSNEETDKKETESENSEISFLGRKKGENICR